MVRFVGDMLAIGIKDEFDALKRLSGSQFVVRARTAPYAAVYLHGEAASR